MTPSRFASLFACLALLAAVAGCSRGAPYAIEVEGVNLTAGGAGHAEIRFVPGPGFKWNEEFPATMKVVSPGTVQLARRAFTRADGDFASRDGAGILRFEVTPGPAGASSIAANADFSVCNDDECRIFRAVPVEIPVQVR